MTNLIIWLVFFALGVYLLRWAARKAIGIDLSLKQAAFVNLACSVVHVLMLLVPTLLKVGNALTALFALIAFVLDVIVYEKMIKDEQGQAISRKQAIKILLYLLVLGTVLSLILAVIGGGLFYALIKNYRH